MQEITLPILKSILLSFGYNHVQTLPLGSPNPKTLHIVLKTSDISWRAPILKHLKELSSVFGEPKFGNSNSKAHNTDFDYIEIGKYKIFASLKEKKIIKIQPGKANELVLYNTIKEYLKQYSVINIKFQTSGKFFYIANVNKVEHVARDISERKKSDINLFGAFFGSYSLSIKEPKFAAWETVETYWTEKRNVLDYALDNFSNKVILKKVGNEYTLNPAISIRCTNEEARDVIFGSDILGKGLVISQKWKSGHFDWDESSKTLILDCENIIHAMSDIDRKLWPYFQLRNHKGHKSIFLPGIAANAVPFVNVSSSDLVVLDVDVAKNYQRENYFELKGEFSSVFLSERVLPEFKNNGIK